MKTVVLQVTDNKLNDLLKRVRKIKYARLKSKFGTADFLSRREQQVLKLIVKGGSSSEIGKQLGISKRTVEAHRTNILEETGCKNTVALVKWALVNGYGNV